MGKEESSNGWREAKVCMDMSTYREEAQDRIAGRLQGTNGTSSTVCSTRRLTSATSPLRLKPETDPIGLGGRPK